MNRFFLIGILTLLFACSNDEDKTENPILCTEEARPGIEVTVKDAEDDTLLIEEVQVVITEGDYSESLENFSGSALFLGAYERPGSYIVIVTKSGYNTFTSDPIVVGEDLCHVITESVEVLLVKSQ
ncbi:peptidase associated/transthyretin-like domain-containing protein [Aquimarina pacifica]|uniref:carboxypeptidase-like regulatory domain-containing protein n=1 Tax=Aquimarina pacifica TaxID=1296415 RepID=UPI00046FC169|nr:carboxypeptidase-like regulatory domain-containing protein [Aquimarina pacifica]